MSAAFEDLNGRIERHRYMRAIFAPLGGLNEMARALDRNITVAHAHPDPAAAQARLELALANLAGARARIDDLELALAQAAEAAGREAAR